MIGETLALSTALCTAIAAVLYKKSLHTIGYYTTNLIAILSAALFILLTLPVTQYQSSTITFNLMALIMIGSVIGTGIGNTLYFMGLKKIGVSRTQSISSSYPLYAMILATLFLHERLTLAVIISTPLIVLGIAIVSRSQNEKNKAGSNGDDHIFGVISSIVAAVSWSVGLTILKIVLNSGDVDPIYAAFLSRLAVLPFLLLAVIVSGESDQLRRITKIDIIVLAVAGMIGLGLGGTMIFVSLASIEASIAIPLSSISPFISILLASLYLREKVGFKIIMGTSLTVTGIVLLIIYA